MNAKQLIANFGRISGAVDTSPRLRRFIVDLAVRGVLLAQDPTDEPASELLQRALAEKRLGEKKVRRTRKPLLELERSQVPFSVPKGWTWAPLEMLSKRIHYGYTASARKDLLDVRLLRITDIQDNHVDWATVPGCVISPPQVGQYQLEAGDILFARTGGTVGKTFLVEDIPVTAVFASYLIRVQPSSEMSPNYLKLFFQSSLYWDQLREGARGGAQPNVNGKILGQMSVTVPPRAEQQRIVAKVDELMAVCDELDEVEERRERRRDRLAIRSQRRMIKDSADPEGFRRSAGFYLDRLSRLTTRLEHISELRSTILELAIRGRIVSQNGNGESASELLRHIQEKKSPSIRRLTKATSPVPLERENLPFPIPSRWVWTQLNEVGFISPRNDVSDKTIASFIPMPLIPAPYGATHGHELKPWGEIKKAYTHLAEGDVGLAKITPCFENGKSVVFRNLESGIGAGTTELHVIRPILVLPEYILLFLKSRHFIETGMERMTGTAGQKRVPKDYFAFSPFPLPPLDEQRRIVSRVDELMAVCDELEVRLHEASMTTSRLLDAVVHEALAGA